MKMKKYLFSLIIFSSLIFVLSSCKKFDRITDIKITSTNYYEPNKAKITITILDIGDSKPSEINLCYSLKPNPTLLDEYKKVVFTNNRDTVIQLTNLTSDTIYYLRLVYLLDNKITYSEELSLSTKLKVGIPVVTTNAVTEITQTTAKCGGNVTTDGGWSLIARGVCWSLRPNPTITDNHTSDGNSEGSFVSNVTNITADSVYYIRAYATNERGTSYGNQINFTAGQSVTSPIVSTSQISNITLTSASCGGDITNNGGSTVSARGVCWSTIQNPTIVDNHSSDGNGSGTFISNINSLTPYTTYYVRAYATNIAGTSYGSEISFSTFIKPVVSTTAISIISQTSAVSGGNVTEDGGNAVTAKGICWSTTTSPTINDNLTNDGMGTGVFISNIVGLIASTTYYVRAYATNTAGTAYGNELSFATPHADCGTVTDADGNSYNTVIIGSQCWMRQNLKTTKYKNNSTITVLATNTDWQNNTTGAYANYSNNNTYVTDYGRLYNWYAVVNNAGLCPNGWHIPSDTEWQTLIDYVGGNAIAGGIIKESGTSHWNTPNTGATDASGFTALPGGYRNDAGYFFGIKDYGYFWSTTENNSTTSWRRDFYYNLQEVARTSFKKLSGLSVRCVKD